MLTQVQTALPQNTEFVQKKDILMLPAFDLQDAGDLGKLKEKLQPFDELRYETDKLHFVTCDDGEWQETMNAMESGHIGFGTKPLGMAPFFIESPQCGLRLEPTFKTEWAFSAILGCDDRRERLPRPNRKKITHHKWMFFSGSDVLITFKYNPELYGLLASLLDQKRRITMANTFQRPEFTGIVLTDEDGTEYDLYLKVYDVCALLGAGGYDEAAKVANVKDYSQDLKKLMDAYKTRMREGYVEVHEPWIKYTLNDLNSVEIFEGACKLWDTICLDMGVPPIKMHLTHGANVVALQEAIIARKLGLDAFESLKDLGLFDPERDTDKKEVSDVKSLLTMLNRQGSAEWLVTQTDDNKYVLGAVDGGRCKNELPRRTRIGGGKGQCNPFNSHLEAVVVDTDIDGCYGNGLMNQLYPIGRATILSFTRSQKVRPTLKDFVSNQPGKGLYKGLFDDLVPGLWYARFSTSEPLSFDQDLLISKLGLKAKTKAELTKQDSEAEFEEGGEGNEGTVGGEFVLLRRELESTVLTHDLLQVVRNVWTNKEWAEFSEKMVLDALIYYPRSQQVHTTDELIAAYRNEGADETRLKETTKKRVREDKRSNVWLALHMGDEWVDKLAGLRKKYPKGSAENTFYKLIINCIYGVACSVFFPTFSNVVVANNITARAKGLSWMMSKTRLGQASITDGSMADLNACLYWRESKPGMHTLANLDNLEALPKQTRRRLEIAPLNLTITDDWEVGTPWYIKEWFYQTDEAGEFVLDDKGDKIVVTVLSNGSIEVKGSQNNWGAFDRAEWAHMKRFFGSGIDILDKQGKKVSWDKEKQEAVVKPQEGLFAFEIKEMYASAAFQSQSNYYAVRADGKEVLKARGNNPKKVQYLDPFEDAVYENGVPIKNVLKAIHDGQPIQPEPRVFTGIVLKVKAWKIAAASKNPNAVQERCLFPGQTTHKASHIKPISISMFRFLTVSQYQSWKKNHQKLREQYGWGLEGFFVNQDGSLDYDRAVNEIQDAIDAGKRFLKTMPEFPTHPMKSEPLTWDASDSELMTEVDW